MRPSIEVAKDLESKYRQIDNLRVKSEKFFNGNEITRFEINMFYESFFLKAHVEFENFIDNLFFGLFVDNKGLQSSRRSIVPKVAIESFQIARQVVQANKKYIDWLPYERTTDLSTLFFKGGMPFTELVQAEKDAIRKSHIIRNAIGHKSNFSIKKFENTVIGSTAIPKNERRPGPYLRGIFRTTPVPQTRFEFHLANLKQIAFKLAR